MGETTTMGAPGGCAADTSGHPCFDPSLKHSLARLHLPVAPRCNIQCLYCDRSSDCPNESRPGLSTAILPAEAAAEYVAEIKARVPNLRVVGIAGPGDPFANPSETLRALEGVRQAHPELLLCAATNGLAAEALVGDMVKLGLSHLTVTMNAIDGEVGSRIYSWIRDGKRTYSRAEGARILIQRQLASIAAYAAAGITVKLNYVLIPGINDFCVGEVAEAARKAGASYMNIIPLRPVKGTAMSDLPEPDDRFVAAARAKAQSSLKVLGHCTRCRADAVGSLGAASPEWLPGLLAEYRDKYAKAPALGLASGQEGGASCASCDAPAQPVLGAVAEPRGPRRLVAVASHEGLLIDQHLGEAEELLVYDLADPASGPVERRAAPASGGGVERWLKLGDVIKDCEVLLVAAAGHSPVNALAAKGIRVVIVEGLISEALRLIALGDDLGRIRRHDGSGKGCERGCRGGGMGCS